MILCVTLKSKRPLGRECYVLRKRYDWRCEAENAFVNSTLKGYLRVTPPRLAQNRKKQTVVLR
ncbi:unnamed protein product [Chondrus crispus]|uniref:Uncharacterized protein n=1 Tax=Chondrus crispus TaxID=2769 RepID=R7QJ29_CHOCR|nr:unnamed protein product [Chondrus crispus]CDF38497.1 unnamed protein product [Chondrus crispus]|eukprot:XP_005718390.1 unnamed protein product [Chondrus crispus]